MTKSNNLDELLLALETIRAQEYPELPPELIAKLLRVEYENQDNRAHAQVQAIKLIDDYLTEIV
jgi:hypothetical protein